MWVVAKERGYFDSLREKNDKFQVPDGETASWFEPADKPKEAAGKRQKGSDGGEGGSKGDGEGQT